MKRVAEWWGRVCRTPRISPGGFVIYAALAGVLHAAVHVAGLREYVSIASGTPQSFLGSADLGVTLGVAYVLFYLACVVIAPMLLVAAGVWLLARHLLGRRRRTEETGKA